MIAIYHRLMAALDELQAAFRDCGAGTPAQRQLVAAATRRVVQADAAWLASGEQIDAGQRAALGAALGRIVRLARMCGGAAPALSRGTPPRS